MKQTPLWRDANALLPEVGQAVRKFPRYHNQARDLYWACRVILKTDPAQDVYRKGPPWTFDRVPEKSPAPTLYSFTRGHTALSIQ